MRIPTTVWNMPEGNGPCSRAYLVVVQLHGVEFAGCQIHRPERRDRETELSRIRAAEPLRMPCALCRADLSAVKSYNHPRNAVLCVPERSGHIGTNMDSGVHLRVSHRGTDFGASRRYCMNARGPKRPPRAFEGQTEGGDRHCLKLGLFDGAIIWPAMRWSVRSRLASLKGTPAEVNSQTEKRWNPSHSHRLGKLIKVAGLDEGASRNRLARIRTSRTIGSC